MVDSDENGSRPIDQMQPMLTNFPHGNRGVAKGVVLILEQTYVRVKDSKFDFTCA